MVKSRRGTGAAVAGSSPVPRPAAPPTAAPRPTPAHLRAGESGEALALAHLQKQGLRLVERNYRVARGPSRRGGEIDLILRDRDGTLVFVEVRVRHSTARGGAAASVNHTKRARLIRAAHHYLLRFDALPPCRFDVIAIEGSRVDWLRAAFDAG